MENMYDNIEYPELYHRLDPKINECINRHINELPMYSNPSQELVDEMVNEIYEEMANECPEVAEDPAEKRLRARNVSSQQRPYYGRGRLLRDIIGIALLSRLFGRRRYPYGYGPGYGRGYGPGFGYGPGYRPGYGYGPDFY